MNQKIPGARPFRLGYLLALLVALVIADGLLTEFLISSRIGREGNIFLAGLVSGGGLIWVKVIGALVSAIILWDVGQRHPRLAFGFTLFFVAAYTGIVVWNISVFLGSV
jgi:hypothetical protein